MTTAELTAEELLRDLDQFIGTEQYHRNFTGLIYTDGVEYFAEKAGAYWLIDLVGSYLPTIKRVSDYFFKISVESHNDNSWNVLITHEISGKVAVVASQSGQFTDLPEGEYQFFLIDGVMLLPQEY